jgi:aldehyde:ferredoxin oxidoreductase
MLGAATGMEFNFKKIMEIGERINNLERAFNVREGGYQEERHFTLEVSMRTDP